jgi:hypothetical protein
MHQALAEWAATRPRIRRIWDIGGCVALELQPVADSEETLAVWMANAERWREELQTRIDPGIELAWFDPDGATAPLEEAKLLVYERGMR